MMLGNSSLTPDSHAHENYDSQNDPQHPLHRESPKLFFVIPSIFVFSGYGSGP
jgi:hypothetical protein